MRWDIPWWRAAAEGVQKYQKNLNLNLYREIPRNLSFWIWWILGVWQIIWDWFFSTTILGISVETVIWKRKIHEETGVVHRWVVCNIIIRIAKRCWCKTLTNGTWRCKNDWYQFECRCTWPWLCQENLIQCRGTFQIWIYTVLVVSAVLRYLICPTCEISHPGRPRTKRLPSF